MTHPPATRITVKEERLDPASLPTEVGRPDAGAVVVFVGTARDHSEGRSGITHLMYEAYREHVEDRVAGIVDEARARWPILDVVVEHRTGRVEVGEPSVAVAVSAAHRDAAFEACRYLIDELKSRAPIWKQEHWPGGSEWSPGA